MANEEIEAEIENTWKALQKLTSQLLDITQRLHSLEERLEKDSIEEPKNFTKSNKIVFADFTDKQHRD